MRSITRCIPHHFCDSQFGSHEWLIILATEPFFVASIASPVPSSMMYQSVMPAKPLCIVENRCGGCMLATLTFLLIACQPTWNLCLRDDLAHVLDNKLTFFSQLFDRAGVQRYPPGACVDRFGCKQAEATVLGLCECKRCILLALHLPHSCTLVCCK